MPCFGTAGFLTAAADYLRAHTEALSGDDLDTLHQRTVRAAPFAFPLGSMNPAAHDIERPVIDIANTLERHSNTVPEKDRYDVILTEPLYGGNRVADEVKGTTHRGSAPETLFLQHIMKSLAKGGRAAVIVPEGVLFRGTTDLAVRRELVAQFDLHTVLSLPAGCFLPYTAVKTNVIFFDRRKDGRGTESVWYYDLTNDGFELKGTRKPLEGNQIPDFLAKQRTREMSERSWSVAITKEFVAKGCDLSARNPAQQAEDAHVPARELVARIRNREERIVALLDELDEMLG
ncbi:MAG: N-6 DNA methylase [Polyangiales bacterium]